MAKLNESLRVVISKKRGVSRDPSILVNSLLDSLLVCSSKVSELFAWLIAICVSIHHAFISNNSKVTYLGLLGSLQIFNSSFVLVARCRCFCRFAFKPILLPKVQTGQTTWSLTTGVSVGSRSLILTSSTVQQLSLESLSLHPNSNSKW